jgi:hypothetical protein
MTKKEIIANIEAMNYYYNEENEESYSFWREAVKKVSDFVKQDIADLRQSMKEVCGYDDELPTDFSFSKKYAEILKPLNLDILLDEN